MQVLEVSYRGVDKDDYLDNLIRRKADKLEKVAPHLVSCRVAVEQDQNRQKTGNPYRVRIDMRLPPGHELVVKRESSPGAAREDVAMILRDAFEAARRRLQELAEKQKGHVKAHPGEQVQAMVVRIFPEQGYGFIRNELGEEIYFHENSVVPGGDFDRMTEGTGVRYTATMGEQGPQATTVHIEDKPGGAEEAVA